MFGRQKPPKRVTETYNPNLATQRIAGSGMIQPGAHQDVMSEFDPIKAFTAIFAAHKANPDSTKIVKMQTEIAEKNARNRNARAFTKLMGK